MIADYVVTALLAALTDNAGFDVVRREWIRVWQLSGVERLHLTGGATLVFKYAAGPFANEDRTLRYLAAHGVPVPRVRGSATIENTLGMLIEDLGPATREANEDDAAIAAARLHNLDPAPGLATLDETTLRALPARSLGHIHHLRDNGRLTDARKLAQLFHALNSIAPTRAAGADLAPFGICHSELHPTSLHITDHGWHLLDVAKAFNGPGILDLATWHGTRNPADPPRLRRLLTRYVQAGGNPHALTNRAGLPAETWALAWHRIWAAEALLHQTTITTDQTGPEQGTIDAIQRQATGALELLNTS
ncbi:phosphotransferase family enzyme [Micromonospora pisi]|uniref:Phosphotransferase family enzyme n=1 Tax=Micromonospora pisi TaxID=589240 RepID=A0A495JI47_9ACTN|nr:phosphotransferase [Micromonospora pisi]RKR88425.1 phosphotransferase family enzyme [Micromonospora pisi]